MQDSNQTTFLDCLHANVLRRPTQPAVEVDGAVRLTYEQLWQAAGCIAAALVRVGCGPESVVAIELPKSDLAIAAIVGSWRCRAAWVPVPPELPEAVRHFTIQNSGATLSVVDADHDKDRVRKITTIDARGTIASPNLDAPQSAPVCDDLAYIIYTSGTTGQPRGVAVTHRGLVPMLQQQIRTTAMNEDSRSLFLLSMTFDAAVSDMGTILLAGGTLCIESSLSRAGRMALTPSQLLTVISQRRISYVDIPPSLLARMPVGECPDCLRSILIGGEVCPPKVVRTWAARVRLVNVYGPTEATVCTSMTICDPNWTRPSIGQPLQGVTYRIEDDQQEGELLISGPCLAREYIGDPDLTASRFPLFGGERCYRTGDVVRRLDHGEYVFLGRIDRQIKLRGHRIEPEQIEAVMQAHQGVHRVAVMADEQKVSGHTLLTAYVTVVSDFEWIQSPEQDLRDYLLPLLPYWMVPSRIIVRSMLPLTASDKVDYSGLRFDLSRTKDECRAIPVDQDSTELELLVGTMRQVLGNPSIGPDDHFMRVGGDSLRVMELVATLHNRGLVLPPASVIQDGTARTLASQLSSEQNAVIEPQLSITMNADELRDDIQELLFVPPDRSIEFNSSPIVKNDPANAVLLTGSTGFLGSHLLRELLRTTPLRVVCLVRNGIHGAANKRLTDRLIRFGIHLTDTDWQRIEVYSGDVADSTLGLCEEDYLELSQKVDSVIHAAADTNVLSSYSSLRQTNVVGPANIARFSLGGRHKQLMVASTLSVFVNTDRFQGLLFEADDLALTRFVYGGYAQSKWAAEWLLRHQPGLESDLRMIRLGLLVGDEDADIVPATDLLTFAVQGLAKLGCVPQCDTKLRDMKLRLDSTPVSFAAKAMVHLLQQNEPHSATYHIAHPQGISAISLFQALMQECPDVKQVSIEEFSTHVKQTIGDSDRLHPAEAMACLAIARRIIRDPQSYRPGPFDLFLTTDCAFDCANTNRRIEDSEIKAAPADEEFIARLIRRILF